MTQSHEPVAADLGPGEWDGAVVTEDWDVATSVIGSVYFPHSLIPLSRGSSLDLSVRRSEIGTTTIGQMRYGADVRLECGELESAYEVNIPLSGHIESTCGPERVISGVGYASIYLPTGTTTITRWSSDCEVIGIKFDRVQLERQLETILGHPVKSPLPLLPQMHMRSPSTTSWLRLARSLAIQSRAGGSILLEERIAEHLSNALADGFLMAASTDYLREIMEPSGPARPRTIRRTLEHIDAHPDRMWTVAKLAEVSGVGVRQLQLSFQQHVGVSPMEYLRDVRLSRVHRDLVAAGPEETIGSIAYRWGFTHLGRFSVAYRKKYGCTPRDTLLAGPR
ncbi:AraC family transcriptional regulator [Rhodococcus opacus]|uniref:AraC family transcriptional regulator n=1 Tax=Rhodococcus opacus TaxID=37919 RepID=UPI000AEA06FD|nr:AraC family transcriptional regulator [Rhodococcus opacus]